MTHTLHRQGTVENLADDYPMLTIRARGHNDGSLWRMQKVLEMASRYPIVNFGDIKNGSRFTTTLDQILGSSDQNLPILHMVFSGKDDATQFMRDLNEADLGISVVASGLFEEIFQCCKRAGITPHTANYSLGVHGRTDKLPSKEVLEITTMCGHSLVTGGLVKQLIGDVKKGRVSPEKAAEKLARNCLCGIFNPQRAARLLQLIAGKERSV
jgi:hypothetical protein